jgi:hypothetical protein
VGRKRKRPEVSKQKNGRTCGAEAVALTDLQDLLFALKHHLLLRQHVGVLRLRGLDRGDFRLQVHDFVLGELEVFRIVGDPAFVHLGQAAGEGQKKDGGRGR